jgi:uncharacterized protein
MLILNEQQMIKKANIAIEQMALGVEYRVYQVQSTSWGIVAHWMPANPEKNMAGSGPILVHKNGYIKMFNEVAHIHNLNFRDTNSVLKAFKTDAETRIRH